MIPIVKSILENHREEIENNDWGKFFKSLAPFPVFFLHIHQVCEVLFSAGINPFENITDLSEKDLLDVLQYLGEITGKDNNAEQVLGKYAKQILVNEVDENKVSIKDIVKIAVALNLDVYETPDGYYGYDPKYLDYVIINPFNTTLRDWFYFYLTDEEKEEYEFDPSMYRKLIQV